MAHHPLNRVTRPLETLNHKFETATGSSMTLWHWIYLAIVIMALVLGI
jgi:hypothetical protein